MHASQGEASPSVRVFGWPEVPGARYYDVEIFRGTEKILEAKPSINRLRVAGQWTYHGRRFKLVRGRYRWRVRPGFGERRAGHLGPPVIVAGLTIGS
jgi:hypothetical protein